MGGHCTALHQKRTCVAFNPEQTNAVCDLCWGDIIFALTSAAAGHKGNVIGNLHLGVIQNEPPHCRSIPTMVWPWAVSGATLGVMLTTTGTAVSMTSTCDHIVIIGVLLGRR